RETLRQRPSSEAPPPDWLKGLKGSANAASSVSTLTVHFLSHSFPGPPVSSSFLMLAIGKAQCTACAVAFPLQNVPATSAEATQAGDRVHRVFSKHNASRMSTHAQGATRDFSAVEVLNLADADINLAALRNSFSDGAHGYMASFVTGLVARFSLAGFNGVEVLNLTAADSDIQSCAGAFPAGTFGYVISRAGKVARFSLLGFNRVDVSNLATADGDFNCRSFGFTDGNYGYAISTNGKVARFSLSGLGNVEDLSLGYAGYFSGGFTDGTHGYLTPLSLNLAGRVVRFSLSGFNNVEALAVGVRMFNGGFTDGPHGYLAPWFEDGGPHSGKVVRFSLSGFNSVETLDLETGGSGLRGFGGGFTDGTHGYVVPHRDFSKVVRFPLFGFNAIEVLSLADEDGELRGFYGGFADGTYGHVNPYYRNKELFGFGYSGKLARFAVAPHAGPTLAPTPTPTLAPTPASATGDPHLQSIYGERFDLRRPGKAVLIQIPRGKAGDDALLTVMADARQSGAHCGELRISFQRRGGERRDSPDAQLDEAWPCGAEGRARLRGQGCEILDFLRQAPRKCWRRCRRAAG
ncbi:unnamed protein product, partial [Prorocentrum cordatum]